MIYIITCRSQAEYSQEFEEYAKKCGAKDVRNSYRFELDLTDSQVIDLIRLGGKAIILDCGERIFDGFLGVGGESNKRTIFFYNRPDYNF